MFFSFENHAASKNTLGIQNAEFCNDKVRADGSVFITVLQRINAKFCWPLLGQAGIFCVARVGYAVRTVTYVSTYIITVVSHTKSSEPLSLYLPYLAIVAVHSQFESRL